MRVALDGMKLFIGFLILLNFIYFLWPKDEMQPQLEFKRGDQGVSMLLQVEEQDKPPSYESLVPSIYDPFVNNRPAENKEVNASFLQPQPVKDNDKNTDKGAFVGKSTQITANDLQENAPVDLLPLATISDMAALDFKPRIIGGTPELKLDIGVQGEVAANAEIPQCFSLGPFTKKEAAKETLADIDAMGLQSVIRSTAMKQKKRFWVYLPPYSTRQKAVDEAGKLATLGVEDYFIISDGRRDNAISLGIFNKKSDSDQRIKEIITLGYTPKVEVRAEKVSVFWIDTQSTKNVDWIGFVNQRFPDGEIENKQSSCGLYLTHSRISHL
jgi:hypothetical protein